MYRNDKIYGNHNSKRETNARDRPNQDTGSIRKPPYADNIVIDELILKYLRNDSLTEGDQYEIFRLNGKIMEKYCKRNEDEAKMSQLRKFYDEIVSIYDDYESGRKSGGRLIRLLPVARYAFARDLIRRDLLELINKGVEIVSKENDEKRKMECLRNFKNVMEAVIAYSKKEKGGK